MLRCRCKWEQEKEAVAGTQDWRGWWFSRSKGRHAHPFNSQWSKVDVIVVMGRGRDQGVFVVQVLRPEGRRAGIIKRPYRYDRQPFVVREVLHK